MPLLYLTTPGARAAVVSERLRVVTLDERTGGEVQRDVPLHDIEAIVLAECCSLSTPALAECLRREIPVVITGGSHRVLGLALPPAPGGLARIEQLRRARDSAFALALAIPVVETKILNQRRVLQRLASTRQPRPEEIDRVLAYLSALAAETLRADSLDVLRGCEGTAAGRYFEAYARFFPESCPFPGRSRRPPLDPPNAVLSYAYTLLVGEAVCAVHAYGLDPAVGFLHAPADRRPSLALDLIEPFRAPLADAMALDLLNRGSLRADGHFEPRAGGIYLNPEGRRILHVSYERRIERPFTSEQHGRRTSLRAELQLQARALRDALVTGEPFVPFLMN